MSSGQSTLRFRDLLTAEVAQHRLSFRPFALPPSTRRRRSGVKDQVIEGKTPEITIEQARTLLASVDTGHVVGLRDRAILAHAGLYRLPGRGGGQAAAGRFPA